MGDSFVEDKLKMTKSGEKSSLFISPVGLPLPRRDSPTASLGSALSGKQNELRFPIRMVSSR